jgi:signal transduction histidine kinase
MTGEASNEPEKGSATADFWNVYRASEDAIVRRAIRSFECGTETPGPPEAVDAVRTLGHVTIAYLVRAYHTEPKRLTAALTALQLHMEAVTDAYLRSPGSEGQSRLELATENRRLRETSRIKSEFLASMNHELRTPLTSIIGFSELMVREKVGALSGAQQEYLGDILTSSKHLLHLINGLVDFAKLEAGKVEFKAESVELGVMIDEVCAILRGLASMRRVSVETFIAPDVSRVFLDPGKLKQVVYNYLSNAIKFSDTGGIVTIRAVRAPEARVRIEVADTGAGIRPEQLSRLFVEFQDPHAAQNAGAGFGLLLTKRLVEAQGGEVGVRSERGQGTVFWALLPMGVPA